MNLPSQVCIVPEQTAARKKKNNSLKRRQKFRLKKIQVQFVVQSLVFFSSYKPFMAWRRSEQKARESIASFSFFPPGPLL